MARFVRCWAGDWKTSRWSGVPSITRVRHVPHTPVSHVVRTATPFSRRVSAIVRPESTRAFTPLRAATTVNGVPE